jgi:hypothetical protein
MVPLPPPGFPRIKAKWQSSSGAAAVIDDMKLRCADVEQRLRLVRANAIIFEALFGEEWLDRIEDEQNEYIPLSRKMWEKNIFSIGRTTDLPKAKKSTRFWLQLCVDHKKIVNADRKRTLASLNSLVLETDETDANAPIINLVKPSMKLRPWCTGKDEISNNLAYKLVDWSQIVIVPWRSDTISLYRRV